jgi:hypothetical protein
MKFAVAHLCVYAIFFLFLSCQWDEWLHTELDASRIRALGSALSDTEEEVQKKAAEAAFRLRVHKQYGFDIFDCERDGNCLFRAVSHQIYGTVDKHAEIRQRCFDYMAKDREYFSAYIAEDFDAYIQKRRRDKEW